MSDKSPTPAPTAADVPTPAELHAMYLGLQDRVNGMADELARNTLVTEEVKNNTADLVELFTNARGAFKALEGLGKVARPLMWISGFVGSALTAWAAWKSHRGGA